MSNDKIFDDQDLEDMADLLIMKDHMSRHIAEMYACIVRLERWKNKNNEFSPLEFHKHIEGILCSMIIQTCTDTLSRTNAGDSSIH